MLRLSDIQSGLLIQWYRFSHEVNEVADPIMMCLEGHEVLRQRIQIPDEVMCNGRDIIGASFVHMKVLNLNTGLPEEIGLLYSHSFVLRLMATSSLDNLFFGEIKLAEEEEEA
jgi:hypothetical protein